MATLPVKLPIQAPVQVTFLTAPGDTFTSILKDFNTQPPQALLDLPVDTGLLQSLRKNLTVQLEVFAQPQSVRFKTVVDSMQHTGLLGFWVKLPTDLSAYSYHKASSSSNQKRQFVRVNTARPVTITLKQPGYERFRLEGTTVNLSAGGMWFTSGAVFPTGCELTLTFDISADCPAFTTKAQVITSAEAKQGGYADTRVEFLDISETHRQLLTRECFRLQVEANRKAT